MITNKNINEALKKRYFEKIKEFFKKTIQWKKETVSMVGQE